MSYPTSSAGFFFRASACPAMADAARRTPANVKSLAITPRQPDVPKEIVLEAAAPEWPVPERPALERIVLLAIGGYCILWPKPRALPNRAGASRKSKAGGRAEKMTDKIVVMVTCGSAREARRIARALVERRLAACANILAAPMRSIYRWKGKVESASEFLLLLKTSRRKFAALEKAVRALHRYDVPEIIALPIAAGSRDYLAWISDSFARPKS